MKRRKLLIGFAVVCILGITFVFIQNKKNNSSTISYNLEGRTYHLLTAKTQPEWEKGLMYVRSLPDADGMIFLFSDNQVRNFWNMNTYVDLDLYWIEKGKVVKKSYLPSIKRKGQVIVSSDVPVDTVIELLRK